MKSKDTLISISILLAFFGARASLAAPCCASGSAAPALISGDDQAQFTATISRSTIIGDAPNQGVPVFRSSGEGEVTRTVRLDMATLVSDRLQAGISVPIVQREVTRGSSSSQATRFGDLALSTAYETLPEWSYSAWKPRGLTFLQLTLPTGRSVNEAQEEGLVDATGRGFFTLALGGLFTKKWNIWDAYAIPEAHYSFSRTFDLASSGESVRLSPGLGLSLALGVGLSPGGGNARLGLRLQPSFNQGRGTQNDSRQQAMDTSIEGSYLFDDSWTGLLSYTDQTLLGPARNTTLSRVFALGLQHRFQR